MNFNPDVFSWDSVKALLLDLRVQMIFSFVIIILVRLILSFLRPRMEARNKAVFITGCDTGMGHWMAKHFDGMGMRVFAGCLHPNGDGASKLKECCSDRLHVVPLDITKDDQVQEAVAYVKAKLSPEEKGLHCLINNAGVLAMADFVLLTPKLCQEVVDVNLMGTIRVTKHFLPIITEKTGRIVTITSILARLAYPQVAIYVATKYALSGFFTCLRYELFEKGIHIAIVEPGDFSTSTDIMQWMRSHLDEIWDSLSPEDRITNSKLFHDIQRRVLFKEKCSISEQEKNFGYLFKDVEDAMFSEAPQWRYVSGPLPVRITLWILRNLPETWMMKFIEKHMV